MFGSIGGPEIILILGLALLLFGPRRLPDIGRQIGRTLGEFRKAASDFKRDLEREVQADQVREAGDGLQSAGREIRDSVESAVSPNVSGSAPEPPRVDDGPASQGQ